MLVQSTQADYLPEGYSYQKGDALKIARIHNALIGKGEKEVGKHHVYRWMRGLYKNKRGIMSHNRLLQAVRVYMASTTTE